MAISRPLWLVEPRLNGTPGILAGDGAPVAEVYDLGVLYLRRDAVGAYLSDGAGVWTQILDGASTVADHPATACTGAAVTDHPATPCTGAAVDAHSDTGNATLRHEVHLGALAAAGVALHAAYVGGAGAIDDAAGPWVQTLPIRGWQITGDAATVAADWTIDFLDVNGSAGVEVIAHPGGAVTVAGLESGRITRVRSSVDPGAGASVLVETSNGFSVGASFGTVELGVDGVIEAIVSNDPATGTVYPTTAPNAAHIYDVRYTGIHKHAGPANHTVTQPSTAILAHTVTQPSTAILPHTVTP